jgi:protein-tyrosine phosphatase
MPLSGLAPTAVVHALRRRAGAIARGVRDAADRALHGRRRAAALQRLGGMRPGALLFVCEGNIYRSPFAAGAFVRALRPDARDGFEVASAGFVGPGRASPAAAVAVAAARGVDLTAHQSRLIVAPQLDARTLVVVMEPRQQRALVRRFGIPPHRVLVLGDLDPRPITTRAIADPWGLGEPVLQASYARIDRCVRVLVAALAPPPTDAPAPAAISSAAASHAATE